MVHYFATAADQHALLDYLGEPSGITLHPWFVVSAPPTVLSRVEALASQHVMIANSELGPPAVIRQGDPAMEAPSKSGVFNRLNWERLRPGPSEGLVDSNASPVLFWSPGAVTSEWISESELGSQADSIAAVSPEYARWVNRATNWVRRKGTKVWGLERSAVRPDLDIRLTHVTTMFALPGALEAFERKVRGTGI